MSGYHWSSFSLLVFALFAASSLAAQNTGEGEESDAARLERELSELRTEFQEYRESAKEKSEREARYLTVFGDIGLRFHFQGSNGKQTNTLKGGNEINRMEYRVRFGIAGYILEQKDQGFFKHRTKYEIRVATVGVGDFDAPLGSPSEAWRPVDAFGSANEVQIDRANIQHDYKQWLRVVGGRFGSPFHGTQLVFDNDFSLAGGYFRLDLGVLFGSYEQASLDRWLRPMKKDEERSLDRLWLQGAGYYLAQNNIGLPNPDANEQPHGMSAQLSARFRFSGTETVWTNAFGVHLFQGEDAIPTNIGTGSTFESTTVLDPDGTPRSDFSVLDLYSELILLEQHVSSLKLYVHALYNLAARGRPNDNDNKEFGISMGVQWGALEFDEGTRPFRLSYAYHFIEPNATIPEFNHDDLNTNYRGHSIGINVSFTRGLIVWGTIHTGRRVDNQVAGVGNTDLGLPGNPSRDTVSRYRLGIMVRF